MNTLLKKIPIIVIAGATASGKSETALSLAESIGGEIISGDSMQIYRGMDIGTAKPSDEEMQAVPHHLVDILDISSPFSVRDFISLAKDACEKIYSHGKIPILAGGTGLYIKLLLSGTELPDTEATDKLRTAYAAIANAAGNEKLHDILRCIDPESADKIHPNNLKRVIRALEVYHTTGKTISEWNKISLSAQSPFVAFTVYLRSSRDWLYERINKRVDKFFELGLENEVKRLCEQGLRNTPTASQAIGYKEFFPYFDGQCEIDEVREQIKKATRNYAKRQETFFSAMDFDIVLDAEKRCEVKVNNIKQLLKNSALCGIIF